MVSNTGCALGEDCGCVASKPPRISGALYRTGCRGGFGLKGRVYAEEIIVPYLARLLRRPVCWIEDRQENLLNSTHSRDDVHDVVVAFDGEGRIVALTDRVTFDCGA